jgi:hypothetical protein
MFLSLCTAQRWIFVVRHDSVIALCRPALPSMTHRRGAFRPRSMRPCRKPSHAAPDSAPQTSRLTSRLVPSESTATAASTGRPVTRPALRTLSAIASRYRYTTLRSASDCVRHVSLSPRRVVTIRDTALLDSGAFLGSWRNAPRIRRVFPPDRYTPATASLTSRMRRWYRGTTVERHSSVPPSSFVSRPRGSVSSTGPVGPVSVLLFAPLR